MTPSRAAELLEVETRDAWAEYLDTTQPLPVPRYYEVEPWAWERLKRRLRRIAERRELLVDRAREDDGA